MTENVTREMIAAGFEVIEEELGQSADYVTYHLTGEYLAKLYLAMRKLEPSGDLAAALNAARQEDYYAGINSVINVETAKIRLMKIEKDEIVFSTGKRIYAFDGIIGIDDELDPSYGSDGGIEIFDWEDGRVVISLSHAERRELADYAIALWQKFAALTDEEILVDRDPGSR
jgi:hypothetical protein